MPYASSLLTADPPAAEHLTPDTLIIDIYAYE
jgi:hypothetical protein